MLNELVILKTEKPIQEKWNQMRTSGRSIRLASSPLENRNVRSEEMMNKRCMKYDLVEARNQISEIISSLGDDTFSEEDYLVNMQHVFHHLNIAWNVRFSALAKYQEMSDRDFNRWGKFPDGKEWKQFHRTTPRSLRR